MSAPPWLFDLARELGAGEPVVRIHTCRGCRDCREEDGVYGRPTPGTIEPRRETKAAAGETFRPLIEPRTFNPVELRRFLEPGRRRSKGWRRHVRRIKAARRRG